MPRRSKKKQDKDQPFAVADTRRQGSNYADVILPLLKKIFPKGSFSQAGQYIGAGLGASASTAIGANPTVGGMAGRKMGQALGGKLAQLVGFGDYQVLSNTITKIGTAIPEGMDVPAFVSNSNITNICHREYICDVVVPASPSDFSLNAYAINPANATLFPWLAPVAARYQQYRFKGLIFEFKTLSSDITAGGALGAVIMGTNYDAIAQNFSSKVQMENTQFSVSSKPSRSQIHAVECDPAQTQNKLLYCRDDSASTLSSDDRFYDLGIFQIATVGLPGTPGAVLGELWCSYDLDLYKPDLSNVLAGTQNITGNGSVSKTNLFGSTPVIKGTAIVYRVNINAFTFSDDCFILMTFKIDGTNLALPTLFGSAAAKFTLYANGAGSAITTMYSAYKGVDIKAGDTLAFDVTGSSSVSASYCDLIVLSAGGLATLN